MVEPTYLTKRTKRILKFSLFVCFIFYPFPLSFHQFPSRTKMILLNNKKTPNFTFFGCKIGCLFCKILIFNINCGEGGIRTPGTSQYAGFQDRCNRPLCHLSEGFLCLTMWSFRFDVAKVYQRFEPCKSLQEKFQIFFSISCFWGCFLVCLLCFPLILAYENGCLLSFLIFCIGLFFLMFCRKAGGVAQAVGHCASGWGVVGSRK